MRLAILSDIHANREALTACLTHARQGGFDRLVFLGDYVGYGADPQWALETVAREVDQGAVALLGNHDQAAAASTDRMNEVARAAMAWTRTQMTPEHLRFIGTLPLQAEIGGVLFVHASPHEPASWHYVVDAADAAMGFQTMTQQRGLCGHVHVPAIYHLSATGKVARFVPVAAAPVPLSPSWRWLMVLGAVGQPRDGSPAACYGLLDLAHNTIAYQRVPYDTQTAARKVRAAGLPEVLAQRLLQGF